MLPNIPVSVAVVTGWGGAFAIAAGEIAREKRAPLNTPRVLAFSLKGNDTLPDPPEIPRPTLQPPPNTASAATIARGRELFHPYCSNCHGDAAVSGSFIPDLRNSPLLADAAAWRSVVHDGALRERGMVSFSAELSPEDVEAIRAYVISRAHDALAERSAGGASAP